LQLQAGDRAPPLLSDGLMIDQTSSEQTMVRLSSVTQCESKGGVLPIRMTDQAQKPRHMHREMLATAA
jgi:hypothetical protein